MSDLEKMLKAYNEGGDLSNFKCNSRVEEFLKRACCGESCDDLTPRSRIEFLLKQFAETSGGGGSGGVEINGLIEEYKVLAGENINAGDFIDFINNVNKQLNKSYNSCYGGCSCCLVDTNKVFIAYAYGSSYYLYGTIVEINGTEMTATTKQLNSTSKSCSIIPSCVLLENNKVFIAHAYSSSNYLYGTIVEINGTEMTATSTQLSSETNSCYIHSPKCVLLEYNKVFISHCYDKTNKYLYGTIVTIDGTTMNAILTKICDSNSVAISSDCVILESNKVFIAHNYGGYYLYGTIVNINGNEITATTTQLDSTNQSCYGSPKCLLLESNKVFIAHNNSARYYLYGTIVEIDGTSMTPTTTQLNNTSNTPRSPDCCLLNTNKVFIAHSYDSNYLYLYATIVEIDGTSMTPNTIQLDSEKYSSNNIISCVLLEPNKAFISHSYTEDRYLYGTIYFGNEAKQPTTNTFKGIAKTSGTEGQTIQVYVPNKE